MQVNNVGPNSVARFIKYQIGEAMPNRGVPVEVAAAGTAGIQLVETVTALDIVGLAVDKQETLVTAQQTDNSDPARMVSVCVNPDAIYRARMSGGSTSGTALTEYTVTDASTTGLDVDADTDFSNFDEGTVWFTGGNNAALSRRIGVGDATDATVVVAFPYDIATGDTFCVAPYGPPALQYVQLTTDLTEVDASVAVDTDNVNFLVQRLELADTLDSYAYLIPNDHYMVGRPS